MHIDTASTRATHSGVGAILLTPVHFFLLPLPPLLPQAGSLTVMDKALSCMDEAKRKKLEEMVQAAAQQGGGAGGAKRPGAAARPAAAAASRSSSRGPSQPASVSGGCSCVRACFHRRGCALGDRLLC